MRVRKVAIEGRGVAVALVATILSALVAGVGAIGVFWPVVLLDLGRALATPTGLLAAAAFRVVFGATLWISAHGSRAPHVLQWVGGAVVVAGLATPLFGAERAQSVLDAMAAEDGAWVRVGGAVAVALGIWCVWVLSPRTGGAPQR